jgi:hypothetical protein
VAGRLGPRPVNPIFGQSPKILSEFGTIYDGHRSGGFLGEGQQFSMNTIRHETSGCWLWVRKKFRDVSMPETAQPLEII